MTEIKGKTAKRKADADDILQTYMNQIKQVPLLTAEEEQALSARIKKGDKAAVRELIEANLRLVVKLARAHLVSGVSMMDMIQEGNIGLMHAAAKFDADKNARFSTYANWWIRQAVSRFVATKSRTIKLPNRKEGLLHKVQIVQHWLCQTLKRAPKNEEIAAELGLPLEEVELVLGMSSNTVSLEMDGNNYEECGALSDTQEDYTYCPVRSLLKKSSHDDTMRFLDRLKGRERSVILYRFQFVPNAPRTFQKIGESMGISAEAVRQIEKRALQKLHQQGDEFRECVYA
jgi:RNA polymerase primary sigma factor